MKISVAISSCPNDTFSFYYFLHEPPEGIEFETHYLDIQQLNEKALQGKFDIVKASYYTGLKIRDRYTIMRSGSAIGFGAGPILISRKNTFPNLPLWRVALPGKDTTAHVLFNFFMEKSFPEIEVQKEFMVFSDIMDAVQNNSVDAGVVIHEGRFVYQEQSLHLLQDLGEFWETNTGFPVPLGGIFMRKSMEPAIAQLLENHLQNSVRRALQHREKKDADYSGMLPYIREYSQEISESVLESHIQTYVNNETVSLSETGEKAIAFFFEEAARQEIKMKKDALRTAIQEHSYRENHVEMFTLASGKKSPYYFDLKKTLLNPAFLETAAELLLADMEKTLGRFPDAVAGLTMGADPLIYAIVLEAHRRGKQIYPVVVRKVAKDHGSGKRAEGLLSRLPVDPLVVLIDDVITTGGSTLQAFNAMKELKYNPHYAFCVLDRKEGGRENLTAEGVMLHSLFSLEDFREQK